VKSGRTEIWSQVGLVDFPVISCCIDVVNVPVSSSEICASGSYIDGHLSILEVAELLYQKLPAPQMDSACSLPLSVFA
jgi:hypothetical protein